MMNQQEADPRSAVLNRCEDQLGPNARAALSTQPEPLAQLIAQLGDETKFTDVLLSWAFCEARNRKEIREEFVVSLLPDLERIANRQKPRGYEAKFDKDDVLQSMLREALPGLFDASFTNRQAFVAYLATRIGWKATEKVRQQGTLKRGGERLAMSASVLARTPGEAHSELSRLTSAESHDDLVLRIMALPDGLRIPLMGVVSGKSVAEIAEELHITSNAVQHRLDRAREKLRPKP